MATCQVVDSQWLYLVVGHLCYNNNNYYYYYCTAEHGEKFGEFDETNAICQYFTHPIPDSLKELMLAIVNSRQHFPHQTSETIDSPKLSCQIFVLCGK